MNTELTTQSTTTSLQAQRLHKQFESSWSFALFVLDTASFVAAAIVADAVVMRNVSPEYLLHFFVYSSYIFVVFWVALFYVLGLYRRSLALSSRDEFYYGVAGIAIGIIPQFLIFTVVPRLSSSRLVLVLSAVFAVAFVGISRSCVHALRDILNSSALQNIAIIGASEIVERIVPNLRLNSRANVFRVEAEVGSDTSETRERLCAALRQAGSVGCNMAVLAEVPPSEMISHLAEAAAHYRIRLAFALPGVRLSSSNLKLERSGDQLLIETLRLHACTPRGKLVKRITDLTLAVPILVLALPSMVLAAIAIWLEDGAPVVYRQERVGRNGKTFWIYKLRTMRVEQSSQSWAVRSDPRITKVGAILRRFSIDELPQIVNVLRGEMSIVGPRPEMVSWANQFSQQCSRYDERHLVRPGITGWSQIHMKRVLNPSDVADVLQHDLFYIEHWSLLLDVSIVWKTAFEFLFHRPA